MIFNAVDISNQSHSFICRSW